MTKFLVLYLAPATAAEAMAGASPEDMQKGMEPWMAWAARCGDKLVDMGSPLGSGQRITSVGGAPSGTEVTGYSSKEAIGENPRILSSGKMAKEFYEALWLTILSGETWHGELLNKKKNGELYWEDVIIAPVLDENKTIVNFIAIKNDITDKKLAVDALRDSELALKEANATKDKFFSIIAHDLRNPIGTISSFAEYLVLNSATVGDIKRNEIIKLIYESSNSTFNLLENLLNWAKSQAGKLTVIPNYFLVDIALQHAIEPQKEQAKKKEITISTNFGQDLNAYGDLDLFSTVVRNLVSNAIKFTPHMGNISIQAKTIESHIEISVIDSGVGIETENLNNLFKLGQSETSAGTDNEKGTGMGLLIVKEFVEKNGGEIWVESYPGKGSIFTFSIPKTHNNI